MSSPHFAAATPIPTATTGATNDIAASDRDGPLPIPNTKTDKPVSIPRLAVQDFPVPKLRLEIHNMRHEGAGHLLALATAPLMDRWMQQVLRQLYQAPGCATTTAPTVRSVSLIGCEMHTLASTQSSELDREHKQIRLSLAYVQSLQPECRAAEVAGVLVHELVHCLAYDGQGSANQGLLEGIADWVRLRCGLAPPHWKRGKVDGDWDAGYEQTAFFLDYLTRRFGEDTVRRINEKMRIGSYDDVSFWKEILDWPVARLWEDYLHSLEQKS